MFEKQAAGRAEQQETNCVYVDTIEETEPELYPESVLLEYDVDILDIIEKSDQKYIEFEQLVAELYNPPRRLVAEALRRLERLGKCHMLGTYIKFGRLGGPPLSERLKALADS